MFLICFCRCFFFLENLGSTNLREGQLEVEATSEIMMASMTKLPSCCPVSE